MSIIGKSQEQRNVGRSIVQSRSQHAESPTPRRQENKREPDTGPATLASLIEAARHAPSPDNNQPWAFVVTEEGLELFHVRQRAVASDCRDLFSWLSIGAAIENIALAASTVGQIINVRLQPPPYAVHRGAEHVATLTLGDSAEADALAAFIESRCTNRRPYRKQAIARDVLARLSSAVPPDAARIAWITDRAELRRMAALVKRSDQIRFEHQPFHEELHRVIRYSEAEAAETEDGMSLRALEAPPGAGLLMRFLRSWRRAQLVNSIGASRLLAGLAAGNVMASGALGLLTIDREDAASFTQAGRAMQRLWLAATRENLAAQPLASIPLFLLHLEHDPEIFQARHRSALSQIADELKALVPDAANRTPVMLMRFGDAAPPTARTRRYDRRRIMLGEGL